MCHLAKCCQHRLKDFLDIVIFILSKWPQSAILDLKKMIFKQPFRVRRTNVHKSTKFHRNRSN